MAEVVQDVGALPGPPVDLPSLDARVPRPPVVEPPIERSRLRIEVSRPAEGVSTPVLPYVSPTDMAAPEGKAEVSSPVEPYKGPPAPATPERDIPFEEAAGRGVAQGLTFGFGPAISGGLEYAKTGLGFGREGESAAEAYERVRQAEQEEYDRAARQRPWAFYGAELPAAIATSALPGLGIGRAATIAGRLMQGVRGGTAGGVLWGAGEATSAGESPADIALNAAKGGAAGGVLGLAGGAVAEAAAPQLQRGLEYIRGIRSPQQRAEQIIRSSITTPYELQRVERARQALTSGPAAADLPHVAADYLGPSIGGRLLNAAANLSPEAGDVLREFAHGRRAQIPLTVEQWLKNRFGIVSTPERLEAIRVASRRANAPNYQRAEAVAERRYPQGIFGPQTAHMPNPRHRQAGALLERLSGTRAVMRAMREAVETSNERSIQEGLGAMNPRVTVDQHGFLHFRNRSGLETGPSLRVWDYTQRQLRDEIGAAQRAGRNEEAGRLTTLRHDILGALDELMPEFAHARGVAAAHFGLADATELGEAFARGAAVQGRKISDGEMARAMARMSPAERTETRNAFIGTLARKLVEENNRRVTPEILNQVLGSGKAQRSIATVMGPAVSQEIQALLRVSQMMEGLHNEILGNSKTVQRGLDVAAAAGAGSMLGGSWGAMLGTMLHNAARELRSNVTKEAYRHVAEMLLSDNPADIQRALQTIVRNPQVGDALRHLSNAGTRGMLTYLGPAGTAAGMATVAETGRNMLGFGGKEESARPERGHDYEPEADEAQGGGVH